MESLSKSIRNLSPLIEIVLLQKLIPMIDYHYGICFVLAAVYIISLQLSYLAYASIDNYIAKCE